MQLPRLLVCIVVLAAACQRAAAPPPPDPRVVGSASAWSPETAGAPSMSVPAQTDAGGAPAPSTVVLVPPPDAGPKDECADSNDCVAAASAVCCEEARAVPPPPDGRGSPFNPFHYELRRICTTSPEQKCESLELCRDASCRRPWPKVQVPCGGITCTAPTPNCVLDLRLPSQRPAGDKGQPPKCMGDGQRAPVLPGGSGGEEPSAVFHCLKSEDCPRGATCSLFYFSSVSSICVYNTRTVEHGAFVVPMCRQDSDCKKLVPDAVLMGVRKSTRCRRVRGAPDNVRACEVPGFAEFW